jgi:hypothetical protein
MANTTWGELSWSAGAFGGENDATVSVTGQSLTSSLNSVSLSISGFVNLIGEQLISSLNNGCLICKSASLYPRFFQIYR